MSTLEQEIVTVAARIVQAVTATQREGPLLEGTYDVLRCTPHHRHCKYMCRMHLTERLTVVLLLADTGGHAGLAVVQIYRRGADCQLAARFW